MERILLVTPTLDYCGTARQLVLLATGLPRERFWPHVCVLDKDGPLREELRAGGIEMTVLGWHRLFDPKPLWHLRQLIKELAPAAVHTWGPTAAWVATLASRATPSRLILSAPSLPTKRSSLSWLDRWLHGQAKHVVVADSEGERRCRMLGFAGPSLEIIPPAVRSPDGPSAGASLPGLPTNGRLVVCAGPLEPHKGFRDAIWAFDILQYVYDDLHLVLAGTGSDRSRLMDFARVTAGSEHIHFLGQIPNLTGLFARAEVVWVPSSRPGGINVALEAQAVGKPVVASRLAGLEEVVSHGGTGFLITPGDKVGLARQTRRLLDEGDLRRQLGQAAQERARRLFSTDAFVERYARLYTRQLAHAA